MKQIKIILFFFLLSTFSYAQVDSVYYGAQHPNHNAKEKKERNDAWKEKFVWGGNLQAWIGNPTFILLTPTIGFIPFENFHVGVGGIYNYTSYRSSYGNYSQSIYGAHSYARYIIGESYFLQVQYDRLLQPNLFSPEPKDKVWVDYLFFGGGFTQSISDKVALNTSIMYNVNHNLLSIYPSRLLIQFGITGRF
jgi:hypothetical protein